MATFRKRGGSWQAQIRRLGHQPISRSFPTKDEALRWARMAEHAMDAENGLSKKAQVYPANMAEMPKLGDLLARYEREITPTKRGADREFHKLRVIQRHPISKLKAALLKRGDLSAYRDDRLALVKPATAKREIAIIRHCLEVAMLEWDLPIQENPARRIRIGHADVSRQRRLSSVESTRFYDALERSKWFVKPIVLIALETGMRRGEIFSLTDRNLSDCKTFVYVFETKNGKSRTIPLSPYARSVFAGIKCLDDLIGVNISTFREGWLDLLSQARIKNFRFHDLRHEAISRFFELGLTVPEVALISGHKDVRMLFRYTHLRPENVAKKLADLHAAKVDSMAANVDNQNRL